MAQVNIYDKFSAATAFNVAAKKIPVAPDAPDFDPGKFGEVGNCLAYALDRPDRGALVPGMLSMKTNDFMAYLGKLHDEAKDSKKDAEKYHHVFLPSCERQLKDAARKDGLIEVVQAPEDITIPKGHALVAMALRCCIFNKHSDREKRHWDLHWYRQDSDGLWSHRMGNSGVITRQDASGKSIPDPRTADRGEYERFSGFFLAPRNR
jgi:hypothetical protein